MKKLFNLKYIFKSSLKFWDQFWFSPVDLFSVCLMRFFVFSLMFVLYLERQINIKTYYFNEGFVPLAEVKTLALGYFSERFWFYPQTDETSFFLHFLFLSLLLLIALGVGGRKITWLAFILHVSFLQRNLAINYGVDLYNTYWLLYFSLIKNDNNFSILNLFKTKKNSALLSSNLLSSDLLSSVGLRLIQIQIVIAYVYAGIEKLKGGTWWKGVALWQVLANTQITPYDWSFVQEVPLLLIGLTYLTLVYEIYSPIGFFDSRFRPYFVVGGMLFHLGIALSMGIYFFGFIMMFSLLAFVEPSFLRRLFLSVSLKFESH